MPKVFLAVTIDTECDKGAKWKVQQPLSFKNITRGVIRNLQPIFDKHQVKPTYLISPEVLFDNASVSVFRSIQDRVELGTHLHAEFINPEANFLSDNTHHYQSDFSHKIEEEKLINLTELFIKKFGFNPLSFRAGRFGISKKSLHILEHLGYMVDSSVTPDMHWKNRNGNSVNFFGAPYQPYFPSYEDFRKEGTMKILQVPVSLLNSRISKLPLSLKRKIKLEKSYQHIFFNYLTNFSKPIWLRPTYSSLKDMIQLTEQLQKIQKEDDLFLCMMFHSNEFELGTSPYSLTQESLSKIMKRLDDYLQWINANYQVETIGLSEAVKYYPQYA